MLVAKAFSVVQGTANVIFHKYFSFSGLFFISMNHKEQQM